MSGKQLFKSKFFKQKNSQPVSFKTNSIYPICIAMLYLAKVRIKYLKNHYTETVFYKRYVNNYMRNLKKCSNCGHRQQHYVTCRACGNIKNSFKDFAVECMQKK